MLSPDQGVVVGRHILNWDFELGARSIAFEGTLLFFRGVIIIDMLSSPVPGVVVGRHILDWDFELGARSVAFEGTLLFFRGVFIIDMLSSPVPSVVVGRHIPSHRRLLLGFQHKIVLPGFFFTFTFS